MRAAALALVLAAGAAAAQGVPQTVPQSVVVVLDRDELFSGSLFGQRVSEDIEAASRALANENRMIEAELEAEERSLTTARETTDPAQFRQMATTFDERVTDIRRTQDAKARAIQQQTERAQSLFLERANPILLGLAAETGALVILDRRIVIASSDQIDITDIALARIDATLGDGGGLIPDVPAPQPRPLPEPDDETDPAQPPDPTQTDP